MNRRARSHLPGATFHLTTRLHRREALFTSELRTALVSLLREQVAIADVELFAYAVMPNHFHLVVRQGDAPLPRFMQPLLRRAAILVQRSHGREGHVFERRYRDQPCTDPDHLRNAIVYTHLNPVRAGLCVEPDEYAWSSHGAWVGSQLAADGRPHPVSLERASQLFASGPERTPNELWHDYLAFQRWRQVSDRLQAGIEAGEQPPSSPSEPRLAHGDANWVCYLTPRPEAAGEPGASSVPISPGVKAARPDLSAIARVVLSGAEPGLNLNLVRSRWGGPPYVRARHRIIRRAAAAGYRGAEIAAYLRISATAVSDVITAERKRLLDPHR